MKKLLIMLCLVCLLFPAVLFAECIAPGGRLYQTGCCGNEAEVYFTNPGGFSPIDPCACGMLIGADWSMPYRWDSVSCTATVYVQECGGEVFLYLVFHDDVFEISSYPAFRAQEDAP